MGYTTWFSGQFDFDKPLDDKTYELLVGLSETRRTMMAFKQEQGFGIDGEFYIQQPGANGITVDDNKPPRTQPGLWLNWCPTEDRLHLKWNESEKFYCYIQWLVYIQTKILDPAGYKLSGTVEWQGEDDEDIGLIQASEGVIKSQSANQPKWKTWCAEDVTSTSSVRCFMCGGQASTRGIGCPICSLAARQATAIDDYYYGRSDTIDLDSLRPRYF